MIIKNQSIELETVGEGVQRKILASGGDMMTVEVHFKKGAIGAVHTHPHEQISYILAGSFEFEMNGKKEVLQVGDTYYVGPNVPHGVVALEDAIILDVFTPQREDFLKKA
ncbi:MAG: cupin domain-containing protein [Epulopiscium sp.]|nr:cupin domain-containing protein [Candidatus Epulonipiscium sp.]